MASKRKKKKRSAAQSAPPRPRLEGMDRLTGRPSGQPRPEGADRLTGPSAGTPRPSAQPGVTVRMGGQAPQAPQPGQSAAPAPGQAPAQQPQAPAKKRRRRGLFGRRKPRRRSRGERLRAIARRKKNAGRRFRLYAVGVYLLCALLAAASFFPIGQVEIRGLTHYPAADVRETFGVEPGENMFFCMSAAGAQRLRRTYPYFESVRITRTLPDTLVINVVETDTVAAVGVQSGGYYLVDEKARVLEQATASGETPRVTGMNVAETEIGKTLSNDADGRVSTLKTLLTTLKEVGMLDKITSYCLVDLTDIYICYEGRVAVRLGTVDNLEQKLHDMDQLLEANLSPTDVKKLDLTGLPTIRLIPSNQDEVDQLMRGEFSRAGQTAAPTESAEGGS